MTATKEPHNMSVYLEPWGQVWTTAGLAKAANVHPETVRLAIKKELLEIKGRLGLWSTAAFLIDYQSGLNWLIKQKR